MTEVEKARKRYDDIPVPEELSFRMQEAIHRVRNRKRKHVWKYLAAAVAVVLALNVLLLNTSQVYAQQMEKIPVIGQIAHVFTFRQYTQKDEDKEVTEKIPQVKDEDQANQDFIVDVNEEIQKKCDAYTKKARQDITEYKEAFLSTGGTKKQWQEKNIKVKVSYTIKCETNDYVSFVVTGIEDWNGSTAAYYYYNLDLKNGKYVSLKDILGDDYISTCNQQIRAQMKERVSKDSELTYFTKAEGGFTTVSDTTNFYLNQNGNPVVVFEKYEVAPGFMGQQEFEICK